MTVSRPPFNQNAAFPGQRLGAGDDHEQHAGRTFGHAAAGFPVQYKIRPNLSGFYKIVYDTAKNERNMIKGDVTL